MNHLHNKKHYRHVVWGVKPGAGAWCEENQKQNELKHVIEQSGLKFLSLCLKFAHLLERFGADKGHY